MSYTHIDIEMEPVPDIEMFTGSPLDLIRLEQEWKAKSPTPVEKDKLKCSIEGCDKLHDARGLCATHYKRWKRTGEALRE
jgi:hypothetical protein